MMSCDNCEYADVGVGESEPQEPCKSCIHFSNWKGFVDPFKENEDIKY